MKQQAQQTSKPKSKRDELWEKIRGTVGLYRYRSSGTFYANIRRSGKLHTESLRTKDRATAVRLLRDFKSRLDRTDPKFGKISFLDYLTVHYVPRRKMPSGIALKQRPHSKASEVSHAPRRALPASSDVTITGTATRRATAASR